MEALSVVFASVSENILPPQISTCRKKCARSYVMRLWINLSCFLHTFWQLQPSDVFWQIFDFGALNRDINCKVNIGNITRFNQMFLIGWPSQILVLGSGVRLSFDMNDSWNDRCIAQCNRELQVLQNMAIHFRWKWNKTSAIWSWPPTWKQWFKNGLRTKYTDHPNKCSVFQRIRFRANELREARFIGKTSQFALHIPPDFSFSFFLAICAELRVILQRPVMSIQICRNPSNVVSSAFWRWAYRHGRFRPSS